MRWLPLTLVVVACTSTSPAPAPPADAGPGVPWCASKPDDWCGGRLPNACKGSCILGPCQAWCDPGFADCNHEVADGCEVDLLHDPQSCGACNATAPMCADGLGGVAPETLGDCGFTARGLAVDATTVYAMCDGDLRAMPKQGGAGATLSKGEWGDPRAGLALDGGFIYWAWPSIAKSGGIRRMPVSGGAIETVLLGVNPASNLLFHDGVVYFADRDSGQGASHSRIVDGTGRTVLEAGGTVSLVAIGDVLYVDDGGSVVRSVRFDGTDAKDVTTSIRAFATDGSTLFLVGETWFRSYQGGNLSLSLGSIPFMTAGATMAAGSKTLYLRGWATYEDGCLGGQGAEVVAAIDAARGGAVVRARIPGYDGLLSSSEMIDQLAEDASYVYFATSSYSLGRPGTIARFAK